MGPTHSASYFAWGFSKKRQNLANGGLHFPYEGDGSYQIAPPRIFSACEAVTFGEPSGNSRLSGPKEIIVKLHARRGQASVHRLRRVSVNPDGDTTDSLRNVGEVLEQCDVYRAFGKAPHLPIAGPSVASDSTG